MADRYFLVEPDCDGSPRLRALCSIPAKSDEEAKELGKRIARERYPGKRTYVYKYVSPAF